MESHVRERATGLYHTICDFCTCESVCVLCRVAMLGARVRGPCGSLPVLLMPPSEKLGVARCRPTPFLRLRHQLRLQLIDELLLLRNLCLDLLQRSGGRLHKVVGFSVDVPSG